MRMTLSFQESYIYVETQWKTLEIVSYVSQTSKKYRNKNHSLLHFDRFRYCTSISLQLKGIRFSHR